MKTIRTIKQDPNGPAVSLDGTPIIIIALEGGRITIRCQGSAHVVTLAITQNGEMQVNTLAHDVSNEKYERDMDTFGKC
jgi:hypothetical protein